HQDRSPRGLREYSRDLRRRLRRARKVRDPYPWSPSSQSAAQLRSPCAAFVGSLFRLRRGTSKRPNQSVADVYVLEVVSGPLDGKTWAFEREITIGRDDSVVDASISLDRYV